MRFIRSSVIDQQSRSDQGPGDLFSRLHLLPVLLAPFVLLLPVWLTGKALFWGTVALQFVPWRVYAWEVLRSGHLPLWNPLNGMGAPLFANYQTALLYPPNWSFFLLQSVGDVGWAAWGLAILAALHLAWAGLGMAQLARQWGLSHLAQTISGLAFGLSAYLVSRLGFLSINSAIAWLPWIILCVEQLNRSQAVNAANQPQPPRGFRLFGREVWRLRWLAVCLALQLLAGHAQTVWFTLLLAFFWAGALAWQKPNAASEGSGYPPIVSRIRNLLAGWIRLGLAVGMAIGLAAIQLFPTAEYLMASHRASQVGYELAMTYSFWPWRFLSLLAPDMFGNPVRGDYWGYGNYWEDAVYIGLLPLILGLTSAVKRHRRSMILLVLVIASFQLALGKNTPVFPWLYEHVPMFSMFQAPTRISILAIFALALMAGMGVDHWRRPVERGLYWTRLATAGGFAVTIGASLAWYFLKDVNITYLRATALAGVWGLGTGLLSLTAPVAEGGEGNSGNRKDIWRFAVTLFVSVDLLVAGWGLNPGIDRSFYRIGSNYEGYPGGVERGGRLYIPKEVEETLKFEQFMRFDTFDPGLDWRLLRLVKLPNINLLDQLPSVNNFDPLVPAEYHQWMEALADSSEQATGAALNLMAVSEVEVMDPSTGNGIRFDQHPSNLRLRAVPCAVSIPKMDEAMELIFSGQIDPNRQVVIEPSRGMNPAEGDCAPQEIASRLLIASETPNRLVIEVTSDQNGWLVLSDTYYPGWQATIDGNSTPIYRANGVFRGVQIHSGTQTVIFSYRPISFYLGAFTSLLSLFVFGFAWRRGR